MNKNKKKKDLGFSPTELVKVTIFENKSILRQLKEKVKKNLGRSIYDIKKSNKLNLNLNENNNFVKTIKSNLLKKKEFFITTNKGFYHLKNGHLYQIMGNNNGFFAIASSKNKFFTSCTGSNFSEGGIVSFNFKHKKITDLKIEYKISEQSLHGITINNNYLYLVNSTWRYDVNEIIKFKIQYNSLKFIERIKPKIIYPFLHINEIFFHKNNIFVLYHNWTKKTKIPSQLCRFDNKWNFQEIVDTKFSLSGAHDIEFINNSLYISNSENSIFVANNNKIFFRNKFVRGFTYDLNNFYIGLSDDLPRDKRKSSTTKIGIVNKKNLQKKIINLPDIGSIAKIKLLK